LKRIVRVVRVARQPAADGQHHRPVPADQFRERGLVAVGGEPAEQLAVGG
jgi:hypothetical protein